MQILLLKIVNYFLKIFISLNFLSSITYYLFTCITSHNKVLHNFSSLFIFIFNAADKVSDIIFLTNLIYLYVSQRFTTLGQD